MGKVKGDCHGIGWDLWYGEFESRHLPESGMALPTLFENCTPDELGIVMNQQINTLSALPVSRVCPDALNEGTLAWQYRDCT